MLWPRLRFTILIPMVVMAVASCASIGGLIPESGKAGERITQALKDSTLGIERVAAYSTVDNFDRQYKVGVWVEPGVDVTSEFLAEVLMTAVPLIKHPGIRDFRLRIHQERSDDDQDSSSGSVEDDWVDLKAPLEELLVQWPDKDRWGLAKPEVRTLWVKMDAVREFVKENQ